MGFDYTVRPNYGKLTYLTWLYVCETRTYMYTIFSRASGIKRYFSTLRRTFVASGFLPKESVTIVLSYTTNNEIHKNTIRS